MKNIIYGYRKLITNEIVYVGQTTDLQTRRLKHEKYDPFNPNVKEYNYPLSKGIRKYGIENYECVVLEEVDFESELNDREKYWIKFYNTYEDNSKYNLTPGGSPRDYKFTYFSDKTIETAIDLLKNTSISFQEISDITGISVVMLSEINHGKRRHIDNVKYPLRELTKGKKLTENNLLEIKELLEHSDLPMTQIAQQYNVVVETIRKINKGKRRYHNDWNYPLRKENKWIYKN